MSANAAYPRARQDDCASVHPNPDHYAPTDITGGPDATCELALTDPDFKFPQVWWVDVAVDQKLPWGWIGTAEGVWFSY
jgi:hypothetical protein